MEADYAEPPIPTEGLVAAEEKIFAKLFETPPTTLAGAHAIMAWLIEFEEGCVPFKSYEYLETLLKSPIFADKGLSEPPRDASADASTASGSDPAFGVIEAHKKAAALFETPPTTLAGARALLEYFAESDKNEISADECLAYLALPPCALGSLRRRAVFSGRLRAHHSSRAARRNAHERARPLVFGDNAHADPPGYRSNHRGPARDAEDEPEGVESRVGALQPPAKAAR